MMGGSLWVSDGLAFFMCGRWNFAKCMVRCEIEASKTEYVGKRMKKNETLSSYIDEQALTLDPYLQLPADRVVEDDEAEQSFHVAQRGVEEA